MIYRKKTIRKMTNRPTTRQLAKLINDLHSIEHKLNTLLTKIHDLETDSIALQNAKQLNKNSPYLYNDNVTKWRLQQEKELLFPLKDDET